MSAPKQSRHKLPSASGAGGGPSANDPSKWSGVRPSAADVLELFPAGQAAAVLEAAGTTTWHHFEKPPAGANLVALPLFAAG